jgi:uncharacterized membrane protein
MTTLPPPPPPPRRLRTWLVTGLLIWIPPAVTFLVIRFLVNLVDGILTVAPGRWQPEALLGFHLPGLGVLLALVILLVTGALFANLLGRQLVATWERALGRIPFIGPIYRGSKQVAETVLSPDGKAFRKVVLIRWPHRDSRALAFVTGTELGEVQEKTRERLVAVFLPTTPNPTSGFILLVPEDDVIPLEMTVEEAFRLVVSLGVVVPEWPQPGARDGGRPGLPAAPPPSSATGG